MNDYYVEMYHGGKPKIYLDNMYTLPMCEVCKGKGIFYFTREERLDDSQVCGHCNGRGWLYE